MDIEFSQEIVINSFYRMPDSKSIHTEGGAKRFGQEVFFNTVPQNDDSLYNLNSELKKLVSYITRFCNEDFNIKTFRKYYEKDFYKGSIVYIKSKQNVIGFIFVAIFKKPVKTGFTYYAKIFPAIKTSFQVGKNDIIFKHLIKKTVEFFNELIVSIYFDDFNFAITNESGKVILNYSSQFINSLKNAKKTNVIKREFNDFDDLTNFIIDTKLKSEINFLKEFDFNGFGYDSIAFSKEEQDTIAIAITNKLKTEIYNLLEIHSYIENPSVYDAICRLGLDFDGPKPNAMEIDFLKKCNFGQLYEAALKRRSEKNPYIEDNLPFAVRITAERWNETLQSSQINKKYFVLINFNFPKSAVKMKIPMNSRNYSILTKLK